MTRDGHWRAIWPPVVLLLLLLSSGSAWGLTDEEIFRDFRFNFVNPGARAVGLGGAFIAAADDATAAEANPAALNYISKLEVFLEYRAVRPETLVIRPTRRFGSNDPTSTSDFTDFTLVNSREDSEFLSYASFAFPFSLPGERRATVAVSRQVVLDAKTSLSEGNPNCLGSTTAVAGCTTLQASQVDFPIVVNPATGAIERYTVSNAVDGTLDAELVHYNLGFSFELTSDFSLGVTATMADLSMQTFVESEAVDPRGVLTSVHPRVNIGGALSNIASRSTIDGSDTDITYAVGLHWHPDSVFPSGISPLRMGLVWRQGAKLAVDETISDFDAASNQFLVTETFDNVLRVPDRWGVGVSYEKGRHWLFSLDVERIQYSDLLEDFQTGKNFYTRQAALVPDLDELEFTVDDATVVHAGVEFNFVSRGRWTHSLRLGYFNAPDNRIRLDRVTSSDPQFVTAGTEEILRDLFRGGEDDDHYTVGFSLGTPVGLTLQFAGDFSDQLDQYIASAIYRFGKVRR